MRDDRKVRPHWIRPREDWQRLNARNSSDLVKRLRAIEIPKAPLKMPAKKRDTKWVEPKLIAKIEYRDITNDGYVRHSSFKGLA
jgi:ATP-dependent DNA ligase